MFIPSDLRNIFNVGERILWIDKPVRKVFLIQSSITLFLTGFMIVFSLPFLMVLSQAFTIIPYGSKIFLLIFFIIWFGLALLLGLGPFVRNWIAWENSFYVVTDRRIIVRDGAIGVDYDILNLDLIKQVNVNIGFWDVKYGTGTITVHAIGVKPLTLYAVRNPMKVREIIEKAVEEARHGL